MPVVLSVPHVPRNIQRLFRQDELHLDRVVLRFDRYHWARLRRLIDALNGI